MPMPKKPDQGSDPRFKGATPEALARALLRPIIRPSAGQGQTDGDEEDEVSFMRKKPKPGKKNRKGGGKGVVPADSAV